MSTGQKRRTPANFPRMKDRAVGRRARKAQREAFYTLYGDPDFFPRLGRTLNAMAEALGVAYSTIRRWLPDDPYPNPMQITEKGRAVVESGLSTRHIHELETGCQPTALCGECREIG